ncbi:cupredoxin domain-containing protein [Mycolicibacterium stellerae]|uniref:cupredoxin domain-containing protein n=1 Tax=Mycolicibacterium stellerae TaxID=2358193 RepID=UPI000F0B0497|nr:cupredoxin domain-containing protein [Mycolicibacterium stellerae]
MKKFSMFLAAIALLATFATACGASGTGETAATAGESSSENSATAVTGPTLTIADMAFGQPLTVAPGTQINIANNDSVEHSVTSEAKGAFDVHVDGGETKTLIAPSRPGEYPFHCVYHPNMLGTLIVR